jgi:hypothetical protein
MTALDELFRGRVADQVMRSLLRDLTAQMRSNGVPLPRWAKPVLEALSEASGESLPESVRSAIGRAPVSVEVTTWVSVHEAASRTRKTERHITRLALTRKVRAQRVGNRTWQIDLESLLNVIRRSHE